VALGTCLATPIVVHGCPLHVLAWDNCRSCEAGGVDIPPSVLFEQKKKALSLAYFPSRMVVEGKDKLKFNKLRENGQSTK
jgi:hypothetical protein